MRPSVQHTPLDPTKNFRGKHILFLFWPSVTSHYLVEETPPDAQLCHTHTHTYIHTFIHSYIHTFIHSYIHTFIHSYIHTYIRTYLHTYIYNYIYIHTYMHTIFSHTFTYSLSPSPLSFFASLSPLKPLKLILGRS